MRVPTRDLVEQADRLSEQGDPISLILAGRLRQTVKDRIDRAWEQLKVSPDGRTLIYAMESYLPVGYQTYTWAQILPRECFPND